MKVEINENGKMTVTPENNLEVYALKNWCNDYFRFGDDNKRIKDNVSLFHVTTNILKQE